MAGRTKTSGSTRYAFEEGLFGGPRLARKRRILWTGFLAVLAPLLVLLAQQYRWLLDLEQASTVARQAALEKQLGILTKEVRFFYLGAAERILNVPPTILEPRYVRKIGKFLGSRQAEGVSRLFVVNYLAEDRSKRVSLYDPSTKTMKPAGDFTSEVRAIYLAAAPWDILRKKGGTVDPTAFIVEEKDPEHRTILKPIIDESSKLVGLAGMIVDQVFFREVVLPGAIRDALPTTSGADDLRVTVRNAAGEIVLGEAPADEATRGVSRAFSFPFTDWTISLRDQHTTPEQWARANFAANVTLSLVTGVLLLGGILLVLRTTAREMRLSEMKNHFVSNVSHELRTPLASIRVFGEFLRRDRVSSPEKIREYGESIETESRRLTALINNILDFSKIESGRKVYELKPVDLEEVVRSVLDTFKIRLRHSGFEIELQGPEAPLPKVPADRDAIRQVIANLVDNAVKYSSASQDIQVTLSSQADRAVIAIKDHGIGISPEELPKIFERFHRVGTGLVHEVRGSGLGLSIVEHVMRAHGGKVDVQSEVGVGSTFSIHLPTLPPTTSAEDPSPMAEDSAAPPQQSS